MKRVLLVHLAAQAVMTNKGITHDQQLHPEIQDAVPSAAPEFQEESPPEHPPLPNSDEPKPVISQIKDAVWDKIKICMEPDEICDILDEGGWPGVKCFRLEDDRIISQSGSFGMGIKLLIDAAKVKVYQNCLLRQKPDAEELRNLPRYVHPDELYDRAPLCHADDQVTDTSHVSIFWKLVKPRSDEKRAAQLWADMDKEYIRGSLLARSGLIPRVFTFFKASGEWHPLNFGFPMEFTDATDVGKMQESCAYSLKDLVLDSNHKKLLPSVSSNAELLITLLARHRLSAVQHYINASHALWSWYRRMWAAGLLHCDSHEENLMLKKVGEGNKTDQFDFWLRPYWDETLSSAQSLFDLEPVETLNRYSYNPSSWTWIDPAFATFLHDKFTRLNAPGKTFRELSDLLPNPCLRIHWDREEDVNNIVGIQNTMLLHSAYAKASPLSNASPYNLKMPMADLDLMPTHFSVETAVTQALRHVMDIEEWAMFMSESDSFVRCQAVRYFYQNDKAWAKFRLKNITYQPPPSRYLADIPEAEIYWRYMLNHKFPSCSLRDYLVVADLNLQYLEQQRLELMSQPLFTEMELMWPPFPPPPVIRNSEYPELSRVEQSPFEIS